MFLFCILGLKFEQENESDFKDKQDFVKPELDHYPDGGKLEINLNDFCYCAQY